MTKQKPLDEKRRYYLDAIPIYHEEDLKESIKRIMEKIKNRNARFGSYSIGELAEKIVIEILKEEFGKGLIENET